MTITLLTGASSGIGAVLADRLAAKGHNLYLVARSQDKLKNLSEKLSTQYNIQAYYYVADLSRAEAAKQIYDDITTRQLTVDTLINNAGVGAAGDFAKLDLATQLSMLQLNNLSLTALTHYFLPAMRQRRSGTILNVGSMAGFLPTPFTTVYGASKAYVSSFTQALAEENKPFGIRTILLCPGATETGFFSGADMNDEQKKALTGSAPMETPDQVADVAMAALTGTTTVAISGFQNKMLAFLMRFLPMSLVVSMVAKDQRKIYQ